MLIKICGFSGPFTIVILTQYTFCGFDMIQRVLDMTPKVVGAAAAGSGANLEMASLRLSGARGEAAPLGWGRIVLSSLKKEQVKSKTIGHLGTS